MRPHELIKLVKLVYVVRSAEHRKVMGPPELGRAVRPHVLSKPVKPPEIINALR